MLGLGQCRADGLRVVAVNRADHVPAIGHKTLRGVIDEPGGNLTINGDTVAVSTLTTDKAALLIPYLPNQAIAMPTVKSLTGATLNIKFDVFPPVVNDGSNKAYDPSGSSKDSLWDVGE